MRAPESGNVFFYIFLAIALLASLSFAVSQGGRGSVTQLTGERVNLIATEIVAYGDTVGKTVTQLRLRGAAISEISFATPFLSADYGTPGDDAANEVFNPAGGAVIYQPPPPGATDSDQEYGFLGHNEIEGIGTTCGGAGCADLLMALPDIHEDVCLRLNELLSVENPERAGPPDGPEPPLDGDALDFSGLFEQPAGTFGYDETIGDEDAALTGQREACYDTGTQNIYYKVLLPR